MNEDATFSFSGRDSMAQLMGLMIMLAPVPWLPFAVSHAGGVAGVAIFVAAVLAVISGLQASIVVRPSTVLITRKWFFIPYWRYSGRRIEDVRFGGDWGEPEGASGVVVKLDGKEIHIGSRRTMHHLYVSLPVER
jgi:hypothetical protein